MTILDVEKFSFKSLPTSPAYRRQVLQREETINSPFYRRGERGIIYFIS